MTIPGSPAADLHLTVDHAPEPGLLRPAIAALLADRPWPPGPEADVARAVLAAVRTAGATPTTSAARPGPGRQP